MRRSAIVLMVGLFFLAAGLSGCGGGEPVDDGTIGISGRITLSTTGVGIFQVSLTLFGSGSGNIFTDFNGFYRFSNLQDGTYTIVPEKIGYTFLPPTLTVTVSGASLTDQNFLAFAVPAAVSAPPSSADGVSPPEAAYTPAGGAVGVSSAPSPPAVR